MLGASRVIVVFFSLCFIVGGFALAAAYPGEGGIIWGAVLVIMGVGGIAAIIFEKMRYHDEDEQKLSEDPMKAGGTLPGTPLPASYRRTDEVFVDPSTGVTMRVWFEPATGDRRYVAEGDSVPGRVV